MKDALQFQPQQTSSGLGPAKPQTTPSVGIPQPLWEPVLLFYHTHSNCLFLTPHLNLPGSSLCLLPLILLLISGKSWALPTHSKMQVEKKKKKDLHLQLQEPQIEHIKVNQSKRGMIQTHKTSYNCKTVFL